VHGPPEQQVRVDLLALASLFVAGVAYRAAVTAGGFPFNRTFQLQNVLPGWIDVFVVGMALAVVSAWIGHRGARPLLPRRRWFPGACWALSAASFVGISVWVGRPSEGLNVFSFWEETGIHYLYLAVGLFFLLPGIFGPQRVGVIRAVLRNRAVQWLGLISYGLYLWNETLLEKYVQWTDSTPFRTSFSKMLIVVFVATVLVSIASYVVVERPALSLKSRVPSRRPVATPAG
jgi:peptidoglycan/LPS O-acetylase OafA/YrhL